MEINKSLNINIRNSRFKILKLDNCSKFSLNNSIFNTLIIIDGSNNIEIKNSKIQDYIIDSSFDITVKSTNIQYVENFNSKGCVFQDIEISDKNMRKLLNPDMIKKSRYKKLNSFFTILIFIMTIFTLFQINYSISESIDEFISLSTIGTVIILSIFLILFFPFFKQSRRNREIEKSLYKSNNNTIIN